jgi:hypothetical protein
MTSVTDLQFSSAELTELAFKPSHAESHVTLPSRTAPYCHPPATLQLFLGLPRCPTGKRRWLCTSRAQGVKSRGTPSSLHFSQNSHLAKAALPSVLLLLAAQILSAPEAQPVGMVISGERWHSHLSRVEATLTLDFKSRRYWDSPLVWFHDCLLLRWIQTLMGREPCLLSVPSEVLQLYCAGVMDAGSWRPLALACSPSLSAHYMLTWELVSPVLWDLWVTVDWEACNSGSLCDPFQYPHVECAR